MYRRTLLGIAVLALAGVYGYLLDNLPSALSLGLLLAGYLLLLDWYLERASFRQLLGGSVGLVVGLFLVLALVHTFMRPPVSLSHPFVLVLLVAGVYLGIHVGVLLSTKGFTPTRKRADSAEQSVASGYKILDTSAIIDGRIEGVADCGFLEGTLAVPVFVLDELQAMADSSDNQKRTRGRRGLDVLNRIQENEMTEVEVVERDFPDIDEVDSKLIALAREMDAPILTNDFNLNKVATIQNVRILNVNDLSNAVKPDYIPGETFRTEVVREGEEPDQGVGYLEDGTMVVIEEAGDAIGRTLEVAVTSVIQTSAGRMIFAERTGRSSS